MLDSLTSASLNTTVRNTSTPTNGENTTNEAANDKTATSNNSSSKVAQNQTNTIIKDNADGVSVNKILPGTENQSLDPKMVSTLKSYGVMISPDNLKLIAALMKNMPGSVSSGDLIGLLISRKIPVEQSGLISKYIDGKINFTALFSNLDKGALEDLKQAWSGGKLLEKVQQLLKSASENLSTTGKSSLAEEITDNLRLQELLTILPEADTEGNIYFQWPIFWGNQDIPDCLEGEAFVPSGKDKKDTFCMRVLIEPPNLGKVEIALNAHKRELHVHFGVEDQLKDVFRGIFAPIREKILATGDYDSVSFSVSNVRLHKNFFSREEKPQVINYGGSRIDFKA